MKKPNITEGEWEVFEPPMNKHHMVLVDDIIVADSLKIEDAKAISAVPEMLDALMYALELMKRGNGKKVTLGEKNTIEQKIKQTLKKAGVTFDN